MTAIQSRMPLGLCSNLAKARSSVVSMPTPSCIPSFRPCKTIRSLSGWRIEVVSGECPIEVVVTGKCLGQSLCLRTGL